MNQKELFLGIDLGTSGMRIAIIRYSGEPIFTSSINYPNSLKVFDDWIESFKILIKDLSTDLKTKLVACSIDGTSGTLLACDKKGNALGEAVPYYSDCSNEQVQLKRILGYHEYQELNKCNYSSIARALHLTQKYGSEILLRHQADWMSGWLLNNWESGDESNNLKLGWDVQKKSWPKSFKELQWQNMLPNIVSTGTVLGTISCKISQSLELPENLKVIAGTTDSNAAVLATNSTESDGITVLGSTIVIKKFVQKPIKSDGISNHFLLGKWICGGSSNAGGATLRQFFTDEEIKELSNQINPDSFSGLNYLPLATTGDRFPVHDPKLKPILTPRPISDSLFLHGLLEGLAKVEARGWKKFEELGIKSPERIISIGGGANNPQWKKIRERIIGIPIKISKSKPAIGAAKIALQSYKLNLESNS